MPTAAARELIDIPGRRAPEMPGAKPLIGHLWMWRDDIFATLQESRRYGEVVSMRMGTRDALFVYSPEAVERVLCGNAGNYAKDTRGYEKLRLILGEGLVTAEGDTWKRHRRIANPAFHRKAIAGFAETMVRCTEDLAEEWAAAPDAERDIARDMMQLTLRIACLTFFSCDIGEERGATIGRATADALTQFHHLVSHPFPWPELLPTPGNYRFWRGVRSLERVVAEIVAERRDDEDPPADLLTMLLASVDDETGKGLSDTELRDEMLTLLEAGHETTANALAWTLHLLGENPEWLDQVAAELDEVLEGRSPTLADLPRLELTRRVFDEGLRLYPPVFMVGRRAVEDDELAGYHVPAGTYVFVSQWVTHRDPELWEDAETFDPDRFLPERSEGRHRYAYFPFLGGQRKCIGDRFAQMEGVLVLATLLQRFRPSPVAGHPVEKEPTVTLRPRHGLQMVPGTR